MNLEMLKSKKVLIIAISVILIFIIAGVLIYFNWINKKEEISTQPININETTVEGLNEENTDYNQIEEIPENIIEENEAEQNVVEENIQNNNSPKQNTNSNVNKNTNNIPYYIKVNYGAQVVTIYGKDENGNYTKPVKAMVCSTGTDTPRSGVYTIPRRWKWGALFGNVYGQYCIEITGNILFHSVPYLRKGDPSSLKYWEYDKLGTAASAGCVRLTVADVIWLYNNCANGTKVEFYSSSNPGPLGKPSAKKISSYPDYLKNWDPTDPNPNNPWRTYKEPVKQDTSSNQTNNTTQDNGTNNVANDDKTNNSTTNNNANTNSITNNTTTNNNSVVNNNSTNNNVINNTTNNNQVKNEISNNKVEQSIDKKDNKQENMIL